MHTQHSTSLDDDIDHLYKLTRKIFGFSPRDLDDKLFAEIVRRVLTVHGFSCDEGHPFYGGQFPSGAVFHICLASEAVLRRRRAGVAAEDALKVVTDQSAFRKAVELDEEILDLAELMQARFAAGYPELADMPLEAFAHLILPWLVRKGYIDECTGSA